MSGIGLMLLASSSGIGQQDFTTAGTYTWVVPNGVTSCSVLCVGGGGGGSTNYSMGGGGGALAYVNNITVTPGESITVVVGTGGTAGSGNSYPTYYGTSGGYSSFSRSGTDLVKANGGGGQRDGSLAGGTVAVGTGGSGGAGGYGAGGAGGYSGNGGAGANTLGSDGSNGSGGGGGGGANENETSATIVQTYPSNSGPYGSSTKFLYIEVGAGGGGGVGILGSGSNGTGGVNGTLVGGGGGAGSSGTNGGNATVSGTGSGGAYGGGGGSGYRNLYVYEDNNGNQVGVESNTETGGSGGSGAVRIIYPATGAITRSFPSTNTGNL